MSSKALVSEFTAIGELKDIRTKSDGRVKYLLLSTEKDVYRIKVAKDQPANLSQQLIPGCKIEVSGMLKRQLHKNKIQHKAFSIKLLAPANSNQPHSKAQKSLGKILICQKSNCWDKGGQASYKVLKQELTQRGIFDQVDIKMTGCLKKCKKAPNMVVLPDKKHYVNVKPKQIATIIEQHFA